MKKHLSQMMRLKGAKATGGLATTLGIMAVHSQASAAKFTGTDGADDITGSPWDEDDLIRLLDGNDTAYGRGGQDRIYGGNGKDDIYGGSGGDRLFGGNDDDTLDGGSGADWVRGGNDNDTLLGRSGKDKLYGEGGDDRLFGHSGNDLLDGGEGRDNLHGGAGADSLIGGRGKDILNGDSGADTLDGGRGADIMNGGGGRDVFIGARNGHYGGDTIDGGDGDDTLSYLNATENVTVNLHVGKASNNVQLTSIENVIGSVFDDHFVASDAANEFAGLYGADTLSYAYSDEAVTVNAFNNIVSGGFADGDIIVSIERFIGSDHDDHFISTDGVVNPVTDSRYASFNGKAGSDTVSYAYSNESVHANLDSGVVLTDTGSKEKLIQIENAIGTSQDDIFVASAAANTLDGADGYNDMVS